MRDATIIERWMRGSTDAARWQTKRQAATLPLPALRLQDGIIAAACTLIVVSLVLGGRWIPGWWKSAIAFTLLGAAPVVFRALAQTFPRIRLFDVAASYWILAAAALGHGFMGPVVDSVHPVLLDRTLAAMDVRLFGQTPSLLMAHLPGPVMDLLLVCYYSYFLWPVLLAGILWMRQDRVAIDEFSLAMTLTFVINFLCYALVPAVGPRYFMAGQFSTHTLHGFVLTPYLESLMRTPEFTRDCFPSGHTAGTLVVLTFAFRRCRGFAWVMLPVALGLITATLAGRFHYGIDLLCALPLVLFAVSTATAVSRMVPHPVPRAVPAPQPVRKPVHGHARA